MISRVQAYSVAYKAPSFLSAHLCLTSKASLATSSGKSRSCAEEVDRSEIGHIDILLGHLCFLPLHPVALIREILQALQVSSPPVVDLARHTSLPFALLGIDLGLLQLLLLIFLMFAS